MKTSCNGTGQGLTSTAWRRKVSLFSRESALCIEAATSGRPKGSLFQPAVLAVSQALLQPATLRQAGVHDWRDVSDRHRLQLLTYHATLHLAAPAARHDMSQEDAYHGRRDHRTLLDDPGVPVVSTSRRSPGYHSQLIPPYYAKILWGAS